VGNGETNGGMAAFFGNGSNFATAHFQNGGSGQVLWLVNGGTGPGGVDGGDFIRALNEAESDIQFRVLTDGEVRSDVGFFTPAADFAEMLPAVPGLAAGEVLIVGADGFLMRSTGAGQTSVAGVFSTAPGFVGGHPVDGAPEGHIPLAVVGIVPVRASAENGPIRPGDLLVSASLPGHAMRADVPGQGTVIGKALEPLPEGTGLVRILLSLQ
jgi:hypothetical protein